MPGALVIDTMVFVFAAAAESSQEKFRQSLFVVSNIMENDSVRLAVDTNNEILEEYKSNLQSYRTPHSIAIQEFIQSQLYTSPEDQRIVKIIPIREREVKELIDDGFHYSDIKFVRIAPNTDSQIIASEDSRSFQDDEYKQWIKDNLDVEILNLSELKDYMLSL